MIADAAKYRDVREGGVLEGGNCLSVRGRDMNYAEAATGADAIDTNAACELHPHRAVPKCQEQRQTANS